MCRVPNRTLNGTSLAHTRGWHCGEERLLQTRLAGLSSPARCVTLSKVTSEPGLLTSLISVFFMNVVNDRTYLGWVLCGLNGLMHVNDNVSCAQSVLICSVKLSRGQRCCSYMGSDLSFRKENTCREFFSCPVEFISMNLCPALAKPMEASSVILI